MYAAAIAQLLEWEASKNAPSTALVPIAAKTAAAVVATDFLGAWDATTVAGLARLVVQCPRVAPDKDKDKDKDKAKDKAAEDTVATEDEDLAVVDPLTVRGRERWRRTARVAAAVFGVSVLQALCRPAGTGAAAGGTSAAAAAAAAAASADGSRHQDAHKALILTRNISQLVALVPPSSGVPPDVRSSTALALVRAFSAESLTSGLANSEDEPSCQEVLLLCGEFDKCVEACFDQRLEPGLVRSVKAQVVRSSALVSMLRYVRVCVVCERVCVHVCIRVCFHVCVCAYPGVSGCVRVCPGVYECVAWCESWGQRQRERGIQSCCGRRVVHEMGFLTSSLATKH